MPKNFYDIHDSSPEHLSRDRRLPGLHDVLGDVLEQPLRSYSSHHYTDTHGSSSYYATSRQSSQHHLPPLSSYAHAHPPPRTTITSAAQAPDVLPSQHAYHLFNYIPNQGLVHQRTSTQEQDLEPTHPRPRLPPSDPSRKYVCGDCGNRFSKHSTLRNHLLTHSGEKPFECTFQGCGRRFSMACNMQRHLRTHTSASAFVHDADVRSGGGGTPPSLPLQPSLLLPLPSPSPSPLLHPGYAGSRGSSRESGDSPRDSGSRAYYKR